MKKLLLVIITITISLNIFAGDVATFMNLGFSADGNYFLFGEHGVDQDKQVVYANTWLVDVVENSFIKGGVLSEEYKTVVEPGESSIGGIFKLIDNGSEKNKSYKIDYLDQGRPLYVRINDDDNIDSLDFRDFNSGKRYKLELNKNIYGEAEAVSSTFDIELEVISNGGSSIKYRLGNAKYSRKGVQNYKIERVINSSNGKGLIIVISKEIVSGTETNIRYMIETVSLK